ncbi:MAG: hypothetical protein CMO19_01810 [Thaumarchaeota archaeon]|nr:hypothetical protein [Nitrososphaerota archaeon]
MKITIITPIHGKKKHYANMIQKIGSRLNEQTVKPFEWIIVCDDKSTWVKDLEIPKFTTIKIAEKNNISLKRNLALDSVNGNYVLLLDSDQIPESNELIADCIKKSEEGFNLIRIPEKFSGTGGYLKRSYHQLRGLYWEKSDEGIPRFVKTELVKNKRFDPERLHFEDELFFEELRTVHKEAKVESIIIHNEGFELYTNLRKARIAQKQSKSHKIKTPFRLDIKTIILETPLTLLPGVIFILGLRTIAKRILPVESGTSR